MSISYRVLGLAAVLTLGVSARALLVDPSGHTTLWTSANGASDDATYTVALGGSYNLFGFAYTSLFMCNNGHEDTFNNSQYTDYGYPSAQGGRTIAPLFDDQYIYAN